MNHGKNFESYKQVREAGRERSEMTTEPHECPRCRKFGFNKGVLGKPNELSGIPATYMDKALFECPRSCGIVDMKLTELQEHIKDSCDLREFPTKKSIYDQTALLQLEVQRNEPYYPSQIS